MSQFTNEIEEIFSKGGLLSKLPDFEFRKSQQDMAAAVADSLENHSHLIIEAPTGIGKSYAYLIPSIIYSLNCAKPLADGDSDTTEGKQSVNKRKAIISTCTINLQEQLIKKDIPVLQKLLPYDFKPEILKGRMNYICTRRLNHALLKKESLFVTEEVEQLQKIYNFVQKENKGTIQDIPFKIEENIWSQIFAEEGICSSKSCGSGDDTNCFYQKAKVRLKNADLIILNHYLFFTIFGLFDKEGSGYIYADDFVIFDEAHQIEQIAAENVSPSVSKEQIKFWLHKLYNPSKEKGFLVDKRFYKLTKLIISLLAENDFFFHEVEDYTFTKYQNKRNNKVIRIREPISVHSAFEMRLKELAKELMLIKSAAKNDDEENEIKNYYNRLNAFSNTIHEFVNQSFEDHVYWVEVARGYRKNTKLCTSPINMSEFFRENIFNEKGPAIMTSATLSVNRSLDYFKNSIGAENADDVMLESSFDYGRQMKIYISKNIPEPKQNKIESISEYFDDSDYETSLKKNIRDGITKTNGGALVLFTNTKLMKKMYNKVREDFRGEDIMFYAQGEGLPKTMLLKEFKDNSNSVLFGVDSFWMGINES